MQDFIHTNLHLVYLHFFPRSYFILRLFLALMARFDNSPNPHAMFKNIVYLYILYHALYSATLLYTHLQEDCI